LRQHGGERRRHPGDADEQGQPWLQQHDQQDTRRPERRGQASAEDLPARSPRLHDDVGA
jgi:hypothetical protein